jgi:hypothetical protein
MGFDENAFMIAGTAIAIAGVGLYIWDTRKDSIKSAASYGYNTGYNALNQRRMGGSRKARKGHNSHKTTKRN